MIFGSFSGKFAPKRKPRTTASPAPVEEASENRVPSLEPLRPFVRAETAAARPAVAEPRPLPAETEAAAPAPLPAASPSPAPAQAHAPAPAPPHPGPRDLADEDLDILLGGFRAITGKVMAADPEPANEEPPRPAVNRDFTRGRMKPFQPEDHTPGN